MDKDAQKKLDEAKEAMISVACGATGLTRQQVIKLLLNPSKGSS